MNELDSKNDVGFIGEWIYSFARSWRESDKGVLLRCARAAFV